eukprot:scaffold6306_cov135-Amphora_coffeaeformis.AAC.2
MVASYGETLLVGYPVGRVSTQFLQVLSSFYLHGGRTHILGAHGERMVKRLPNNTRQLWNAKDLD